MATEPTTCTRWTPIIFSCVCTFSMGGIIFGASSIIPVLYRHGYWRSLCAVEEAEECRISGQHADCCDEQLVRLSVVISAAFFLCDFSAAPWGEVADRLGARVCLLGAATLSVLGMMLLGLSASYPSGGSDLLTTLGLLALAVAGPGVFNGGYVGSLGMIGEDANLKAALAACSAAVFDGSALVFMLLQMAEGALGGDFTTPSLAWALLCACLGSGYWYYLRPRPQRARALDVAAETADDTKLSKSLAAADDGAADGNGAAAAPRASSPSGAEGGAADEGEGEAEGEERRGGNRGKVLLPSGDLDVGGPPTIGKVLAARSNLLMVYFMATYGLVSNFYIETQLDEFELRFGKATAIWLSTTFNLAFPIGGFCTALPASLLMRRYGDTPHAYWSIVSLFAAGFAILSLIPSASTQLLAALLFGPARCLQWACYFQFLADERRYPADLTGRALGYNNVCIGLVADAMPSLLTYLVASDWWAPSKETRYTSLKLGCLALLSLSALFPYVLYRERHTHAINRVLPSPRASVDDAETEMGW